MKKTKNENCRVTQDGGQFNPNPCIRRKFFIAYKNQSKREVQRRNKNIFFPLSPHLYKQYCRGVLQIVNCKTNIIAQRQGNFLNRQSTEKRIATFSRRTFWPMFFFCYCFCCYLGAWSQLVQNDRRWQKHLKEGRTLSEQCISRYHS